MTPVESPPVTQISRLLKLIGGQGIGIELISNCPGSAASLNEIHILFRDRERSEAFAEQLSRVLLENVRSQDLPISQLTGEEEKILKAEMIKSSKSLPKEDEINGEIRHFQLGHIYGKESGKQKDLTERAFSTFILP